MAREAECFVTRVGRIRIPQSVDVHDDKAVENYIQRNLNKIKLSDDEWEWDLCVVETDEA